MQQELLPALQWRYATRSYDPARIITPALWAELEECLRLTPSSFGLQPWRFLVVKDPAKRAELRQASWNQSQVTDASHYVVLAHLRGMETEFVDKYMASVATARQVPVETLAGFRKSILGFAQRMSPEALSQWNARQTYIALGNLLTAAAVLKVDASPMEGFDPARYDSILGLDGTPFRTVVACALGYRSETDVAATWPKVRFSRAELFQDL